MPESIGAIRHRRRDGAKPAQHPPARLEIPQDRFARWDEIVGEHEPRTGLERSRLQPRTERDLLLWADLEIVQERDRLPVEEKALVGDRTREEDIEERDEPLAEASSGMVPLAVPMGMGHETDAERGDVAGLGGSSAHLGTLLRRPAGLPVGLYG